MSDQWYFAYGSNLDAKQMENRTGVVIKARHVRLKRYRMMFNKRGGDGTGKANIVWDPTGVVWGVIYRCTSDELNKMDPYEGVAGGHYRRLQVQVQSEDGEGIQATTYVAGNSFLDDSLVPSEQYLKTVLRGAREQGFPIDYIHEIELAAGLGG